MIHCLSLVVLAFAVSLDGFGVGLSYGLRRIEIPVWSVLIITFCSGAAVLVSMELGQWITVFTEGTIENKFGAWILIAVGAWAIINLLRNKESREVTTTPVSQNSPKVLKINMKSLGLVIHILKVPSSADVDKSGKIHGWEAVLLGAALSLDAFGAGLGAAMIGFSPLTLAIAVSALSCLLIHIGIRVGFAFSKLRWIYLFSFLPGLLLIIIGIYKLFL